MLKILFAIILLVLSLTTVAKEAIWIHIDTQKLLLEVKLGNTTLAHFSNISLGRNGSGFKKKRGDDITPHGRYKITWINRKSRYQLFFGFNYPSKENAQQALEQQLITKKDYKRIIKAHKNKQTPPQNTPMGGLIGIHGLGRGDEKIHEMMNWTHGCIALTNKQIHNLDTLIKKETLVIID